MREDKEKNTELSKTGVGAGTSEIFMKRDFSKEIIGIPDDVKECGDNKKIQVWVANQYISLDQHYKDIEHFSAHMQTMVRLSQGRIISELRDVIGPAAMKTFAEDNGISLRTAYNYLRLYKKSGLDWIYLLGPSKTLKLLETLKNPEIELKEDGVSFNVDGEKVFYSFDDAKHVSFREFHAMIGKLTTTEKKLEQTSGKLEKIGEIHKKALLKRDKEIDELKAELIDLRMTTADDPDQAEIDELQRRATEFTNLLHCYFSCSKEKLARMRAKIHEIVVRPKTICEDMCELIAASFDIDG